MPKMLARRTFAAGQWWEAGADDIPEEVARAITNPKAWATEDDSAGTTSTTTRRRTDGPRLAGPVNVGGTWYGPDDDLPEDVARRIRNPKAWEGGELPTFAAEEQRTTADATARTAAEGGSDDNPTAQAPAPSPEGGRVPAPPRSGKGSGEDAWQAWAATRPELGVSRDAKRAEIIAAAERAGVLDKE